MKALKYQQSNLNSRSIQTNKIGQNWKKKTNFKYNIPGVSIKLVNNSSHQSNSISSIQRKLQNYSSNKYSILEETPSKEYSNSSKKIKQKLKFKNSLTSLDQQLPFITPLKKIESFKYDSKIKQNIFSVNQKHQQPKLKIQQNSKINLSRNQNSSIKILTPIQLLKNVHSNQKINQKANLSKQLFNNNQQKYRSMSIEHQKYYKPLTNSITLLNKQTLPNVYINLNQSQTPQIKINYINKNIQQTSRNSSKKQQRTLKKQSSFTNSRLMKLIKQKQPLLKLQYPSQHQSIHQSRVASSRSSNKSGINVVSKIYKDKINFQMRSNSFNRVRLAQKHQIFTNPYNNKNQLSRQNQQQPPIKEQFRYCLGCQKAILEANILHHEQFCSKLKNQIYPKSLAQLKLHLKDKILKLVKTIHNEVILESQSLLVSQICTNKKKINSWINKISQMLNKKNNDNYSTNNHTLEKINFLKTYETIPKINWYLKVLKRIEEEIRSQQMKYVIWGK